MLANTLGKGSKSEKDIDFEGVPVYTSKLYEMNILAQDAIKEFSLQDIDDKACVETKRIEMHNAFTTLYNTISTFSEQIMGEDFDIAFLRERIANTEGEVRAQLEKSLEDLMVQAQQNLADVWMAKVMAWLHQAASASGPFVEEEHEDKKKEASKYLAEVYTMLEKPFSAVATKTDGTLKLRRVALGHIAHDLMKEGEDASAQKLAELEAKNLIAQAEFYDEFLNELIGRESTFRQGFNPFDELLWRDILSSFIFEQATDLYNEAIDLFKKSKTLDKTSLEQMKSWKQNTAGLSEVYLAMTYNDIADAQMRAGNLEDASNLYIASSTAFGRAEKCFREVIHLQANAEQSRNDKEQKKAQSLFCRAASSIKTLSDLLLLNNREESHLVLKDIFKDLRKAKKLSKTRELNGAIEGDLKTFSFVEEVLKTKTTDISEVVAQINLVKDIRKNDLVQDINKSLDDASANLSTSPPDALESIREALINMGILQSLEAEDAEVGHLRNKTLAILNHTKYVIQFQLSSQLQQGVKFILSRILENLHAVEAASYYKVIGDPLPADELIDLGKLALATAYASEAQVFAKQAEQWAFRAQIERSNTFRRLEDEIAEFEGEDEAQNAVTAHDNTILRIKQAVAAFESAAGELNSVRSEEIRRKNNVEMQVRQLQGVVMKFKGDLFRLEGAKADFMAEFHTRRGDRSKAKKFYSDANDSLREAVGNYTVAAQVFQQVGDAQAAQSVDVSAKTTDLLARSVWDNRQRLGRDQDPNLKGDAELAALYQGSTG